MGDSVLLIGSGAREHAIAWKLSQSPKIDHIYIAPGNAGTESNRKMSNCKINVNKYTDVSQFCQAKNISLVVVGPEDPLANGISDHLAQDKILCFGPCKKAAQIEASKEFAKQFMDKHQIPTARWKSFTNSNEAKHHILNAPYEALVIKASGLAAGKGVIVASSREEAVKAVDSLKEDKELSSASETIVIEELLSGKEVSVLCFSDGNTISVMPPAQDHKRLLEGDKGPNTGGMGAYCKCPFVNNKQLESIKIEILEKAINGLKNEGTPFVGVLYAGIIVTLNGPKVLEFNCRFGDPEAQVILPLLVSDLYDIMSACVNGTLCNLSVEWSRYKHTVGIVLVSKGYPGNYPKGKVIKGLDPGEMEREYLVFHEGTAKSSDKVITCGGRVLTVVAVGFSLDEAVHLAHKGCKTIDFEGKYFRSDIAKQAFNRVYDIQPPSLNRKRALGATHKKSKKPKLPKKDLSFYDIFGSPIRLTGVENKTIEESEKIPEKRHECKNKKLDTEKGVLKKNSSKTHQASNLKCDKQKTILLKSKDTTRKSIHKNFKKPLDSKKFHQNYKTKNSNKSEKKLVFETSLTPQNISPPDHTSVVLKEECKSVDWINEIFMYSSSSSEFEGFYSSTEIKTSEISSVHTSELSSFDDEISIDLSNEDENQSSNQKVKKKITLKEAQAILKRKETENLLRDGKSIIVGATTLDGEMMFWIKKQENGDFHLVSASVANLIIPETVIDFYEKHLVIQHKRDV